MATDNTMLMRQSWRANAQAWVAAVRGGSIASRCVATDAAAVNAVLALKPARVLDAGCGEGWLCRALAEAGIDAVGIDAAPELIAAAQQAGGGEFRVAAYDDLPGLQPDIGMFPAIVCNFSLLDAGLDFVLRCLKGRLQPAGHILIQTLHPWAGAGDDYRDGWRVESFAGFEGRFSQSMPWYFRSLGSWVTLLASNGFHIESLTEPCDPQSGAPLSLLLQCRLSEA